MKPTKLATKKVPMKAVYIDANNNPVIEARREKKLVYFVRMSTNGILLDAMYSAAFDEAYTIQSEYPLHRAVHLFAGFAGTLGATEEALAALSAIDPLSPVELERARIAAGRERPTPKVVAPKPAMIPLTPEEKAQRLARKKGKP